MKSLFFASAAVGVYIMLDLVGGQIEGRIMPVVSEVEISRTEPINESETRFWGSFKKLRNCRFEDMAFYLGAPGESARADFRFEEGGKVRSNGYEYFGPWVVQLTQRQLASGSYSIATHRCNPLWLTETRFH